MTKVFQIESPDDSTGFLLWKVTNLWQREIRKALSPYNLTHTQFVILANIYFLSSDNTHVTQVDIATHIGIDKMLTSNVLKALLSKGLITRQEHPTDTRAKVIALTSLGSDVFVKSVKAVEDFDKSFFNKVIDAASFNTELRSILGKE